MKNILLLINQLHTGGAQKVVSRLSIELSRQYNVYLITYNSTESMFEYSGEHIFIKLPFSSNPYENNAIARSIRLMVLIYQVKKIKRKKRIQAAISFLEASNIINVLSKGNEKVILSVRSHLSSELRDDKRLDIFKHMVRLLYNRAFKIVVPSELMKSDLSENFSVEKSKIAVIYNFIDQEQIKELTKEILDESLEKILSNSPFLINVGRMTSPKAQSFLIPILKKVKQTIPSIKLMLLGDGSLKNEFIHSAKQHQLHLYDSNDSRPI
ncbi:MAG TPA: glycosyltransferase, partial [Flavitalea sp.]|nr:glycosyltransferase [Flavitalea sp.]